MAVRRLRAVPDEPATRVESIEVAAVDPAEADSVGPLRSGGPGGSGGLQRDGRERIRYASWLHSSGGFSKPAN